MSPSGPWISSAVSPFIVLVELLERERRKNEDIREDVLKESLCDGRLGVYPTLSV